MANSLETVFLNNLLARISPRQTTGVGLKKVKLVVNTFNSSSNLTGEGVVYVEGATPTIDWNIASLGKLTQEGSVTLDVVPNSDLLHTIEVIGFIVEFYNGTGDVSGIYYKATTTIDSFTYPITGSIQISGLTIDLENAAGVGAGDGTLDIPG